MVFIGGEEISWGQRIIGLETPDFLTASNNRGKFNIHNRYDVEFVFLLKGKGSTIRVVHSGVHRQKIMAAVVDIKPASGTCFYVHKILNQAYRRMFFDGIKRCRLTSWTSVRALIIAGSAGLAFTVYIDARTDATQIEEIYFASSRLAPRTGGALQV